MCMDDIHFLNSKDQRTELLMCKFRLQKHLKRCMGVFGQTFSSRKLWIMFVCVVWLLTREILGSNLALVISFWVSSLWVVFGLTRQMPELYFKLGCKCFFSHPCGICRPQGERIWHLSWNISLVFFLLSSNRRSCAVGCKSFISNCLHFQTLSAA